MFINNFLMPLRGFFICWGVIISLFLLSREAIIGIKVRATKRETIRANVMVNA